MNGHRNLSEISDSGWVSPCADVCEAVKLLLVGIVDYVLAVAFWMDYSSFKHHIDLLILITHLSLHNYLCSASGADSNFSCEIF